MLLWPATSSLSTFFSLTLTTCSNSHPPPSLLEQSQPEGVSSSTLFVSELFSLISQFSSQVWHFFLMCFGLFSTNKFYSCSRQGLGLILYMYLHPYSSPASKDWRHGRNSFQEVKQNSQLTYKQIIQNVGCFLCLQIDFSQYFIFALLIKKPYLLFHLIFKAPPLDKCPAYEKTNK